MNKTSRLWSNDVRSVWKLVGECRELGDDRNAWRDHCVVSLAKLVDADFGVIGEMAGCHTLALRDLGANYWWQLDFPTADRLHPKIASFRSDPQLSPAMLEYHRLNRDLDGLCLTRGDFIEDRVWVRSADYKVIHESYGTDATLWCFRQMPLALPGESSGIVMLRVKGRRDFSRRARALIQEANATLTPLVGGVLAREHDPSPSDLPPRVRQVLACVLQGDGDKQVALRLRLSTHTVNEYTKTIFRHFHVRSRSELLARWIRRGWGDRFTWAKSPEMNSGAVVADHSGYRVSFDVGYHFKPVTRAP